MPQGVNHEVILKNLEPVRRVPPRVRAKLGSDSKEEEFMQDDRRHKKSSDYKNNVDISNSYSGSFRLDINCK